MDHLLVSKAKALPGLLGKDAMNVHCCHYKCDVHTLHMLLRSCLDYSVHYDADYKDI